MLRHIVSHHIQPYIPYTSYHHRLDLIWLDLTEQTGLDQTRLTLHCTHIAVHYAKLHDIWSPLSHPFSPRREARPNPPHMPQAYGALFSNDVLSCYELRLHHYHCHDHNRHHCNNHHHIVILRCFLQQQPWHNDRSFCCNITLYPSIKSCDQ